MIIFCPANDASEAPRLEGGDLQPLQQPAEEGAAAAKAVIQGSAYRSGEPLRHPKEKPTDCSVGLALVWQLTNS
jgi:hypothetical protein